VLRDVVYVSDEINDNPRFDLATSDGISNAVFHILRNANILRHLSDPKLVVCWGGHSIHRKEYDYTKEVGYELGLRGMDICTGCGPGAMKGPMKGATIGHAKQRIAGGQYLGISEPGIIAAESPNPIVNDLVIMPDIEKRLEAFIRVGHAVVVFPGGVGTVEEILYLLGILLHPDNAGIPFPLIFTGPDIARDYFKEVDQFIFATLGEKAQRLYQIIIDDPARVAREILAGIEAVRRFRTEKGDAYYFNWLLKVDQEFQRPFVPTHDNMRNLELHSDQDRHLLAANLRRAFSGVVAGNVKDAGIRAIEQYGHFEIRGDPGIMDPMDSLLGSFVAQHRMKLSGKKYTPCYRIVK
jgi:predicted Rossmann-fold nucleotide-binding protein